MASVINRSLELVVRPCHGLFTIQLPALVVALDDIHGLFGIYGESGLHTSTLVLALLSPEMYRHEPEIDAPYLLNAVFARQRKGSTDVLANI